MTARVPPWLVDAALAVYPAAIRERYGPEIAELLDRSPTPWRDLGNVAWHALRERAGAATVAGVRPYAGRLVALLAAPGVFWCALVVMAPGAVLLSAAFGSLVGRGHVRYAGPEGGLQFGSDGGAHDVLGGYVVVLLVTVAVVWRVRGMGGMLRVPAPAVVIPTALAAGSAVTAVFPFVFYGRYDGGWLALTVTVACWWPAATLLTASGVRLARRGRARLAGTLVAVGTVALLPACWAAYLSVLPPESHESFDPAGPLGSASLPSILTVCTPFAFTLLHATARLRPAA